MLARHWNLVLAAAENVARNPRGYFVAALGLVAGLTLLSSGVAVSEGLKREALASVASGADVYCTWDRFGRDAPVPVSALSSLEEIEEVRRVVPRIIGRVRLGDELPIVIGIPLAELELHPIAVEGRLPSSGAEVLIGHELARAVGLGPGSRIALDADSVRLFQVAGVITSTSSLWSAKAIVCDIDEAAVVFGDSEHVSDVCLYTRPGYEQLVGEQVERIDRRFRVQTKALVERYVARGMTRREGVFTILLAVALALAIPTFAITTYMGHTPRRREIGLLKVEGWRTSDVLEMVAFENLIVSLIAAAGSTLAAVVWVRVLHAPLIAPFFLTDLGAFPEMSIPARFLPLPLALALIFSLVVTMTGSIYTTWRTATARPVEVLR